MPPGPGPSLGDVLPRWDWRGRHTIIVEAPPHAVFDMVGALYVADLPNGSRRGTQPRRPVLVLDDILRQGFRLFVDDRPHAYMLGRIGRFWNRYQEHLAPDAARDDPAWFARFEQPGFAKAALSITCEPVRGGATLLVAETRIVATDDKTLQEFNKHWLVGTWANPHAQEELLRAVHRRLAL